MPERAATLRRANRLEITMAETKTAEAKAAEDAKPADVKAAEALSEKDRKAIHDSIVPPTPETGKATRVTKGKDAIAEGAAPVPVTTAVVHPEGSEEGRTATDDKDLPIAADNGSFYATLDYNANGVATVSILPRGWVGAAPLQVAESELKDLISVLTKLKR